VFFIMILLFIYSYFLKCKFYYTLQICQNCNFIIYISYLCLLSIYPISKATNILVANLNYKL